MNNNKDIHFSCGDSMAFYSKWPSPVTIISDGPYGVSGFPGDLTSPEGLAEWYRPHIEAWSKCATPLTTLWFWNTEIGWASVHPVLLENGWDYVSCNIWNKGLSHVAGNVNTKTIRHLPIVTELCVQYVKKPVFKVNDKTLSMKEWLRYEWERTGLPFSKTNEACGVANAATRKYFTKCHLWYMPPADAFEQIVNYANKFGNADNRPYFSIDGKDSLRKIEWENLRSKFYCPFGVTNVWSLEQLRNSERVKTNQKAVHLNQKPLALIRRIIEMSSDAEDTIWDPFAGLATTAIASHQLGRMCYCSEIDLEVYQIALKRIKEELNQPVQGSLYDRIVP